MSLQPRPPEVSEEMRGQVLQAIQNEDYFLYPDGVRYLVALGLDPYSVVADLTADLQFGARLYALPGNPQKCQCCIYYGDELTVHVKVTMRPDKSPTIAIGFHRHDTGYPTLPR
jgi:hypothetical protein